jgi:hypothetical protein
MGIIKISAKNGQIIPIFNNPENMKILLIENEEIIDGKIQPISISDSST